MKSKIKKLELLLEFSRKNVDEKSLDGLLALLAQEAKTILEADRCTIYILDKKNKVLWSKVAQGTLETIRFSLDKGIAGEAARKGRLINVKDAQKDPRFNAEIDQLTKYATRSLLTVPMKNLRNEVVGVFQVLNKIGRSPFNKEDETILTILASQGAVAVENVQLYEQVRDAAQDTILRLASAAEYKDQDTGRHLLRMSQYASLIAGEAGFAKEFCQNILLASPMHDIGKLGVPDAILGKAGSLNDQEWVEMKKHTFYGGEILKDAENELIRMSQRIAMSHHEKFDGSGYPAGLKGEEIPVEGRITALADVFDALTSKRAYKDKFSVEKALGIIREGNGRHFDPKIIEAFERALPKIIEIMHRLAEPEPDA